MGVAGYTWKMKIIGLWGRKRKTEKEGEEKFVEGKYLEKANIWKRNIFGEGTYLEKENIWRRRINDVVYDRPTNNRQGEYKPICLWKLYDDGRQRSAKHL